MAQKLTTIYIVRHGETEWNVRRIIQGHSDSPLTKKGIAQAKALARRFKTLHFDAIFSSDLVRAKRTAEIIALEKRLAIETTRVLREQFFGKYEGAKRDDYYSLFEKWNEMTDRKRHRFKISEDVESNEEAVIRFITFLREIAVAYSGKTVLVVSHGAIMRYFLIHLGHMTYDDMLAFDNRGLLKLESDGVDFFIKEIKGLRKIKSVYGKRRRSSDIR